MHPTTYRRLERGLAPLSDDTAATLAGLFDTTSDRIAEAYARNPSRPMTQRRQSTLTEIRHGSLRHHLGDIEADLVATDAWVIDRIHHDAAVAGVAHVEAFTDPDGSNALVPGGPRVRAHGAHDDGVVIRVRLSIGTYWQGFAVIMLPPGPELCDPRHAVGHSRSPKAKG